MPEEAQKVLGRVSWIILIFAFLADTAHIRSIPAYNSIIGIWGLYLSHYRGNAGGNHGNRELKGKLPNVVRIASTFSAVTMLSVCLDVAVSKTQKRFTTASILS